MSGSGESESYAAWLTRMRRRAEDPGALPATSLEADEMDREALGSEAPGMVAKGPFIAGLDDALSPGAEQYRVLGARLEGLWKQPGFQRVAITSALPGEGKTLTTVNLGCVLAKDFGRRVLLIDGDFRRPSLWRFLGPSAGRGISDILSSREPLESVITSLRHPRVSVLQSGRTEINPTRLWKSDVMRRLFDDVSGHYDYILVDTPPVMTVVDPRLIADLMDGVVVVVRSGSTPTTTLQKAIAELPRPKLVGTVFNGVRRLAPSYYHYHQLPNGKARK